jgi:tetratricopeptide (TPR) repeat protein
MQQWCHVPLGNFDLVLTLKKDVLRMMDQQFNLRWYVWTFCTAVWAYTALGHWQKALEDGKEAMKVAEKFSDDSLIAFAALHICLAYTLKGDLYQAIKHGELAVQKAPTQADKLWAKEHLAWAQCRAGELQQGLEAMVNAVSINRAGRMRWGEINSLMWLGEGYFLAGDDEKATQTLKECLELAKRSDFKLYVGSSHSLLGRVAMKTDPIQAAYHFEKSIATFQKTKEDPSLIEFMRSLVMLSRGNFRQGVKIAEDISPVFLKMGVCGSMSQQSTCSAICIYKSSSAKGRRHSPFWPKTLPF